MKWLMGLGMVGLLFSLSTQAEPEGAGGMGKGRGRQGQQGGGGPGRTPPQFAQDACRGKRASAVCEFDGPRGHAKGTCENTPDGKYFACRPEHLKGGPGMEKGPGGEGGAGVGKGGGGGEEPQKGPGTGKGGEGEGPAKGW